MSGFAFNFAPAPGGQAPATQAPQAAPLDANAAMRQQIIMEEAFAKGGNVDIIDKDEHERPGTYLELIDQVKFTTSKNEKKGNAGQNFVIVRRRVVRVLDNAQGNAAKVGDFTSTVYKLSKSLAYNDCVLFVATVADQNYKSLKNTDLARPCGPNQPFAGIAVMTKRWHLPQSEEDVKLNRLGFLKVKFLCRVLADELLSGTVAGMGGPITAAEKASFWGGKDPIDPIWVQMTVAEQWVRASGAALPTDDQKAAMSPEQARDYYTKIHAYWTENKVKPTSILGPTPAAA